MKLLFLGSPKEAVPFLEECARGHEVAAVLTRPDRPRGRGLKTAEPPVKTAAARLGLRVLQPERPEDILAQLRAAAADLAVVVAYGRMLGPEVLACARHGFLNVHFSLLPRWRGAAPVAWTLLGGDAQSGVTLFWIDQGLDTGPMQCRAAEPVRPDDDARTLMERLVRLGVAQLREAMAQISRGAVRREPQAGEPTRAPKPAGALSRLDFKLSAQEFHNRVRALCNGPKPHLLLATPRGPLRLAVLRTEPDGAGRGARGGPGSVARVERERGVLVECGFGRVWIREVQPEGKKPMPSAEFLNGLRIGEGACLETIP